MTERSVTTSALVAMCAALALSGCGEDGTGFSLGAEALVEVVPSSLVFGDVPRNGVARRNITVRHIGTSGTIRLDPIELVSESPDLYVAVVEKTELQPGEVSRIQIEYRSDNDPPDFGELVIGHNIAANPETRVPISTPGQRAQLIASPGLVDFGIVQAGAPRTLPLTIYNGGTAPATLTGFELLDDADGDFSLGAFEGTVVPVDGSAVVDVTYAPTQRDNDTATLTILTDREDVSVSVQLAGEEETPVLLVEPGLVQLGWVEPNTTRAVEIVVSNDGNAMLELDSIALGPGAPSDMSLRFIGGPAGLPTNPLTQPTSLRPDEAVVLGLTWTPRDEVPMTRDPLALLAIASNDEARNPLNVPIYGAAGEPSLRFIPESTIDFAFVAEGFTARRSVTILNEGASAVTITGAQLFEPTSDEFAFVNGDALPHTLNPGEIIELELTFENRRGASGTEFARFFVTTTDPVVPEYPLDVVARRAQRPTCQPAFVPDLLAMGAHRPGESGQGTMKVVNFGSGDCEYNEYEFAGCLAVPSGIQTQFECNNDIVFNPFEVTSAPARGVTIGPGEAVEIDVSFVAPPLEGGLLGREAFYARLNLIMFDPNSNALQFVSPPGGWGRGFNVRAESAVPYVVVEPPTLDFGLVRTDCYSDPRQVRVGAIGPVDATVTELELVGCPPGVQLSAPPTPFTVTGFSSVFLEVTYAPDVVGADSCMLRVHNDSDNLPVGEVSLLGRGTDATHQTDTFKQIPPPKVDVLFVVDDSFSMADDQQRLKEELPRLVDLAVQWGQDYHLAVTTTDTINVRGRFQGVPLYATSSTPVAEFADNLVVGTTGHFVERGLEGAYLALYNRSTTTDIACIDIPNACPADDGEGVPMICSNGFCGGINAGFLRDDAQLVVVIVSDEEDGSDRPWQFYVDAFADLKAPNSGVGVILHSIIVKPSGCLGGFGTPGFRYVQATEALGGFVADICASDFSEEFADIGERTFGLTDRFYPTLPPIPSTLQVSVDGVACTEGWTWNDALGAVIFEDDSPCFPAFNEDVELDYDVYCAQARD